MAKTPQRAKAGRARQVSARGAAPKVGTKPGAKKAGKGTASRGASRKTPSQPLLSPAAWSRRLNSWLDHAGGRFSIGIGIGLLVGLIVVVGFNRFNHWVTQVPEGRLQARGELQAPVINDSAGTAKTTAKPMAAASSVAADDKTMEQLITDTQSEVTEPEAVSANPALPADDSVPPAPQRPAQIASNAPASNAAVPVPRAGRAGSPADTQRAPAIPTAPAQPETVAAVPARPQNPPSTPRDGDRPAWLRNAMVLHAPVTGPMIAVVLDDVGVNKPDAELAVNLPPPITLSMMTYADNVADLAARAHARGHELMLHVPMQPVNPKVNPGPNALLVGLSQDELKRRLDWGLSRFPGFIGINNHMGSRFTQDEAGMRLVMQDLLARGLLFLDSRTIANSVGERMAAEAGVPHIGRDVFLDDEVALHGGDSVAAQLALAERIALKRGYAIAIGHPHPGTVAALQKWMADLKQRGFTLVPLSAVARRELGVAG